MTSEGQLLKNRYRLEGKLGSGGMGSVWRAADVVLQRTVALKELVHLDPVGLGERRRRAVREARALAKVSHPAIVTIHDIFFEGSEPWIVMDYIEGHSLAALMRERDGPLGEREIARIGLPVLRGLSAAHAAGVIHRDVKPANILVNRLGQVFLVDFGIARIAGDLTMTGQRQLLGTLEYLAPEQLSGQAAGSPADLWSLGVTFFCALEGYSPFRRPGDQPEAATMMAILTEEAPRLRAGGRLAEIVARLLRKDPARRPPAAELAGVLQAIAAEPGPRPPSRQPPPRPVPARSAQPLPPARDEPPILAPARRPTLALPDAAAARQQAREERARLQEDRERVRRAGPQSGAGVLLKLPDQRAATIIAGFPAEAAGALISGIASARPEMAGSVLRMLSAARAGAALDYMAPAGAAALLGAMPVAQAARILSPASTRTAAGVIRELPRGIAVQLIRAMPGPRAAEVLRYVEPAAVAALLTADGEPDDKLFARLSPQFCDQVLRYLPRGTAAP
jgi:hypothetical protein